MKKHLTHKRELWQPYTVPAIVGIGFRSSEAKADSAFYLSGVFLCPKSGIALYLGGPGRESYGSLAPLRQSSNLSGPPILFRSGMGGIFYISKQRSKPMPSTITISAHMVCTPEEYFIPNPAIEKEIPVDAILCTLSRAKAVLDLITANGDDIKEGFTLHPSILMDALWCLSGILIQAETMIKHPCGIGESK